MELTAEFPSYLLSANPYSIGVSSAIWDIASDINQNPSTPQWLANVAFNHRCRTKPYSTGASFRGDAVEATQRNRTMPPPVRLT
jgi:hypothetical protein